MDPARRDRIASLLPPRWAFTARALRRRTEVGPLLEWIPEGGLVVDVGANRGVYTYWFAKRAGVVHAFEPLPRIAAQLASVAPANVSVHAVALGEKPAMAPLYMPHEDRASSLIARDAEEIIDVPVRPLDDFGVVPDFVKIDVEGAEMAVLRGAQRTLASCPPLYIEIEQRHLGAVPINTVFDFIFSMGYGRGWFQSGANFEDIAAFDVDRHQHAMVDDVMDGSYVHNFLFAK